MAKHTGYKNGAGGCCTPPAPTKFQGTVTPKQTPPTPQAPLRQRYKQAGGGGR